MELLVVAKEPVPGRVKTRLCPPCTPAQAADVAAAALADTLTTAASSGFDRVVLALDGCPGPWLPAGVDVVPQRGGDFAARLGAAWTEVRGPALQVGMDTPQLTVSDLHNAAATLEQRGAVVGPSCDGGWYLLGLHGPLAAAFDDVPMSRADTGRRQVDQLRRLGLSVGLLPEMRDVDEWDDALAVAGLRAWVAPTFAAAVAGVRAAPRVAVGAS